MKIVNILIILLLTISCSSVNNFDSLYGQWPLANFYYKEKCLSCDFKTYNIYFDKSSGWLTLDNYTESLQYTGKFEFIKNKKNELFRFVIYEWCL